jgi:plasmid maintenance system antidote protein VapI
MPVTSRVGGSNTKLPSLNVDLIRAAAGRVLKKDPKTVSVVEIADLLEMSRQHVHRLLAGEHMPTQETLTNMVETFDLSRDALIR